MNDQALSVYILPVNPESDWKYLYIAEDADNLKKWIARRSINEPAFMTVYTKLANWHIVGSNRGKGFEEARLETHQISDEESGALWQAAKTTRDKHMNFRADLDKVCQTLFPKVKRHTPFYLNPVN